ncbi:MAG: hypothetical protein IJQ61_10560 [Bacteroidales bacterium]|nr:hypothetical protein [Bacteroidales bacterium]
MIALPSIAFGGFSGSAKDVTARNVRGRTILGVRSWPTGFVTAAQVVRRSALSKISKAYKNLTDDQMKAWEQLAEHTAGASVFGQKAKLSAHNLFVRLNTNRAYCGEAELLSLPPASIVAIPAVEFTDFCISENCVMFIGVPDPEGELKLVAKMSDGQSSGVSNAWGKTVIISPDKVPDWGEIDLTDAFKAVMGHSPINGQKYFVELYWIDPVTGFTGVPVQVSWICQDGSAHTGRAMAKRTTFKNSDVVDDDQKFITDLDVEFAQGSTIITGDIKYDATKHNVQEGLCHITKEAYDRIGSNFCSFMLGRSNANAGYMPHFFRTYAYKMGREYRFVCAKGGGLWGKIGEVFGTSLTFEFVN